MLNGRNILAWALCAALVLALAVPASAAKKIVFGTSTGGGIRFLTDTVVRLKLDKKYGIEFDFKYFAGPKGNAALLFKKVDASYFSGILAARRALEGDHFVNFEIMMNSHVSFLSLPNKKYTSLKQLRGKRLGFFTRASSIYNLFAVAVKLNGMNVEKDFKLFIGASPGAFKAFLLRGEVEATALWEPFSTAMVVEGKARRITTFQKFWDAATKGERPLLFSTLGATKKWVDENPKAARGLAAAIGEARKWIVEHPSEAVANGVKSIGISDPKILKRLETTMVPIYKTPWDKKAVEAGEWLLERFVEQGFLKSVPKEPVYIKF